MIPVGLREKGVSERQRATSGPLSKGNVAVLATRR